MMSIKETPHDDQREQEQTRLNRDEPFWLIRYQRMEYQHHQKCEGTKERTNVCTRRFPEYFVGITVSDGKCTYNSHYSVCKVYRFLNKDSETLYCTYLKAKMQRINNKPIMYIKLAMLMYCTVES